MTKIKRTWYAGVPTYVMGAWPCARQVIESTIVKGKYRTRTMREAKGICKSESLR